MAAEGQGREVCGHAGSSPSPATQRILGSNGTGVPVTADQLQATTSSGATPARSPVIHGPLVLEPALLIPQADLSARRRPRGADPDRLARVHQVRSARAVRAFHEQLGVVPSPMSGMGPRWIRDTADRLGCALTQCWCLAELPAQLGATAEPKMISAGRDTKVYGAFRHGRQRPGLSSTPRSAETLACPIEIQSKARSPASRTPPDRTHRR